MGPPPSARSPSTSAWKTQSGFPWSAARVRDTLVKSVSTSQTSSLVLPAKLLWRDTRQPCLTAKTTSSSFAQGKCARNINSLSSANVRELTGSVLSLLKIYFHTAVQNTLKPSEFE